MSARKKPSKRPTTRAGRAAKKRSAAPEMIAAVDSVLDKYPTTIDDVRAELAAAEARARHAEEEVFIVAGDNVRLRMLVGGKKRILGNDFHMEGDAVKPGLGELPASLTSSELRDLRNMIKENAPIDTGRLRDVKCQAESVGMVGRVSPDQPKMKEGTIAALIADVMFAAGEVNGIYMLAESIADKHLGPIPETDGRGVAIGSGGSGTLAELHSHIADLNARIQTLGAQVRRFNAL